MSADQPSSSSSWFSSLASCCCPASPSLRSRNKLRRAEKDADIWSNEPAWTSSPSSAPHPVYEQPRPVPSIRREPWSDAGYAPSYSAAATASDGPSRRGKSDKRSQSQPRAVAGRSSMSGRRRTRAPGSSSSTSFFSLSGSRRPQISAPTNFRHLHSESFAFPPPAPPPPEPSQPSQPPQPPQPPTFHPLELSIYRGRERFSLLTSSFDRSIASSDFAARDAVTVPPRVHARNGSADSASSSSAAGHDRNYSSMSFHVPRRPLASEATAASSTRSMRNDDWAASSAPAIPARSRMRSHSSPAVDTMVERIASAMIEMEKLQAEIDSVMERQSIYISSRPTTGYDQEFESLPTVPAMPPAGPSFAERLSTERPQTAPPRNSAYMEQSNLFGPSQAEAAAAMPSKKPSTNNSAVSVTSAASVVSAVEGAAAKAKAKAAAAAAAARSGTRVNGRPVDVPLAPPLPLVLRPPLRKKKSFSRVSNWLFPGEAHSTHDGQGHGYGHGPSLDSATNVPRPVTQREGFYQCIVPQAEAAGRTSLDTVSTDTVSTWTSNQDVEQGREEEYETCEENNGDAEDEEETRTAPTTAWSQRSSPVATTVTSVTPVAAVAPAADKLVVRGGAIGHRPQSVGVAF